MKREDVTARLLTDAAERPMTRLRDKVKESVALVVLDAASASGVVAAKVEHKSGVAVRFELNFRFPCHVAAPTKAILASLPAGERKDIVARTSFEKFTARTITSRAKLKSELDSTRRRGYAVDRGEYLDGVHCVSAPVLDDEGYPVAAIVVSSFSARMPTKRFAEVARLVEDAARTTSETLSGKHSRADAWDALVLEQAAEFLGDNLDRRIDVEQYAEDRNISYSWFRSKFRKRYGVGPKQYHLQLKIDRAKSLLDDSDATIKEIARQLGYDNQNNLSNMFRKKVGVYPTQYRERGKH